MFFYNQEWIKQVKAVDIDVKQASIDEVLKIYFYNQPVNYSIVDKTIILSKKELFTPNAEIPLFKEVPPKEVKGKITDITGVTLPGVSVRVKGTNTGTTTDINGNYTITVTEDSSVLLFTYIGFVSQEVNLNGRTELNIVLQLGNTALNEVIVTALGIERESKSLTYSAQTIQADKFNEAKETNVINSLQGKIAGVVITRNATGPGSSSKVL